MERTECFHCIEAIISLRNRPPTTPLIRPAKFDPDILDDQMLELPDLPLDSDIALDMLRASVTYWEHYGWVASCYTALRLQVLTANYDQVQQLAAWLITDAPKGVAQQYPELVKYAAGKFPKNEVEQLQGSIQQFKIFRPVQLILRPG